MKFNIPQDVNINQFLSNLDRPFKPSGYEISCQRKIGSLLFKWTIQTIEHDLHIEISLEVKYYNFFSIF
jgi:hypothetical protein